MNQSTDIVLPSWHLESNTGVAVRLCARARQAACRSGADAWEAKLALDADVPC